MRFILTILTCWGGGVAPSPNLLQKHELTLKIWYKLYTCIRIGPVIFSLAPKFPHVALELRGWRLGLKERRCWANCLCNLFPRFPTCDHNHQRYRQTDTMQSQYRAMHIVHRAVKTFINALSSEVSTGVYTQMT